MEKLLYIVSLYGTSNLRCYIRYICDICNKWTSSLHACSDHIYCNRCVPDHVFDKIDGYRQVVKDDSTVEFFSSIYMTSEYTFEITKL